MSVHEKLDQEARERCALAACDLLPPAEAAAFARHALECELCRNEAASLAATAGELSSAVSEVAPPEGLWQRIAAKVRDERDASIQSWKRWKSDTGESRGLVYRGVDDVAWEPTGAPGVEARPLYVDSAADRVTMMVRMAAGTSYPGHMHAGPEECYVLSGDLRVGELHMRAGDYQRAEAGSRHPVQSTEGGCTLLLVSSLHDTLTA